MTQECLEARSHALVQGLGFDSTALKDGLNNSVTLSAEHML